MFGRQPSTSTFSVENSFDALSYPAHLRAKLAELRDFVKTNLAAVSAHQKSSYDVHSKSRIFSPGEPVWLAVATRVKLDPKWEGRWMVKSVKGPVNVEISDGKHTKIVHVNRLQHRVQPRSFECEGTPDIPQQWNPSQVEHMYMPPITMPTRRDQQRHRNTPNRFGY